MIKPKSGAAHQPDERLTALLQSRHDRVTRRSKQRAQEHDSIAPRMQPIQNARKRFDCLRAIPAGIVQQDNAAIAPLLFHALQDDVGARFCPVLRINVLQNDEIIEVLGDLQRGQLA